MSDFAEDDNLWREDLFAILGITPEDDVKAIRDRYKKLAKQHHPDRFERGSKEQDEAKVVFAKITTAYDVLTTEAKREHYLQTRRLLADHLNATPPPPITPQQEKQKKQEIETLRRNQAEDAYNYAEKEKKAGHLDSAIDKYQEAIKLVPSVSKYHSHIGVAYAEKGWTGMAQSSFKEALALNPKDTLAQQHYDAKYFEKQQKMAGKAQKKGFLENILSKLRRR